MIASVILVAAAVAWAYAWCVDRPGHSRIAAGVHLTGAALMVALRGDQALDGWAAIGVMSLALPSLLPLLQPSVAVSGLLRLPLAIGALVSAAWACSEPGVGVSSWVPWSIPHIVLATLGMAAAAFAALIASVSLRNRTAPLLLLAILITAIPLIGPRASTVRGYADGEPKLVQVDLVDPSGSQGIVRTLPARASIPWERELRQLTVFVLLLLVAFEVVRRRASASGVDDPSPFRLRVVRPLGLGVVGLHCLLILSSGLPRNLASDVEEVAIDTIRLEASSIEVPRVQPDRSELPSDDSSADLFAVSNRALSDDRPALSRQLSGGPGSPAVLFPLSLLALALVGLAFSKAPTLAEREAAGVWELRGVSLSTLFLAGAVFTGLLWSNHHWGAVVVPDPKLFAVLVALLLYAAYFVSERSRAEASNAPSWLALLAFILLLLSMLGPELGWIAPSLHAFGA